MLEFYYDFMDVFVDRSDFQYCAMASLRVSDTIFFSGSASPARRASLMLSPNFWKQTADVYSTT
jgi:hypothetical protein